MRVEVVLQVVLDECFAEVRSLVALRPQPAVPAVSEHGIQQHQALDQPAERGRPAVTVIGLADGLVERLELHMEQPAPTQGAWRDRRGVAGRGELREKVVCLPAVRDAGEGPILALDEHP